MGGRSRGEGGVEWREEQGGRKSRGRKEYREGSVKGEGEVGEGGVEGSEK